MIEKILWILLALAIMGLILSLIFQKEEVEIKNCPKCTNKVKDIFIKMGDIGLGIYPIIHYKRCENCGWTN